MENIQNVGTKNAFTPKKINYIQVFLVDQI